MDGSSRGAKSSTDMVGDERVRAATGRRREEWFTLLDEAGAATWGHTRIAAWLAAAHEVDPWWCQNVTVVYEQARGLRVPGQKSDGTFTASATKTLAAPSDRVWPLLEGADRREAWAPGFDERGGTPGRRVGLRDAEGRRINLHLEESAPAKDGSPRCRVAVDHDGARDPEEAARLKESWRAALTRLAQIVAEQD